MLTLSTRLDEKAIEWLGEHERLSRQAEAIRRDSEAVAQAMESLGDDPDLNAVAARVSGSARQWWSGNRYRLNFHERIHSPAELVRLGGEREAAALDAVAERHLRRAEHARRGFLLLTREDRDDSELMYSHGMADLAREAAVANRMRPTDTGLPEYLGGD